MGHIGRYGQAQAEAGARQDRGRHGRGRGRRPEQGESRSFCIHVVIMVVWTTSPVVLSQVTVALAERTSDGLQVIKL